MTCQWCGDTHRSDQLCQRAQRGMTRRSFCFLFGAGVVGAVLPSSPQPKPWTSTDIARAFGVPVEAIDAAPTLYGRPIVFADFKNESVATALQRIADKISANYRTSIPLSEWIAPSYRRG